MHRLKANYILIAVGLMVMFCCVMFFTKSRAPQKLAFADPTYGKLTLPVMTAPVSEMGIVTLLVGVRVSPMQSLQLSTEDRASLLHFLRQVCAAAAVPAIHDVYVSRNAQVWQALAANYPEAKVWLSEDSVVQREKVSIKELGKRIWSLKP